MTNTNLVPIHLGRAREVRQLCVTVVRDVDTVRGDVPVDVPFLVQMYRR